MSDNQTTPPPRPTTQAPPRPGTQPPPRPNNPPPLRPGRKAPRRKEQAILLPGELEAWRVEFFRAQGWKAKQEQQTEMFDEMQVYCEGLEERVLSADPQENPFASANLDEKKLKAGKEFKAYLVALKAFEAAPIPRDLQLVTDLRNAAQGYLDHYAQHSRFAQRDKTTKKKHEVCLKTLAELKKYEVREQLDELGPPPWESAKAMQAASLKATLDLESLPHDKKASELGGNHAFPAFWISQDVQGQQEPVKTFLFKPATTEKAQGIPPGGTAPREAAANRATDLIGAMSGIDFNMPETNIVSVSKSRLPSGGMEGVIGGDDPSQADVVGSLQKVADNQGGLRGQTLAAREAMPAEEIQKIILLDMAVLNLDRHADNMLVQPQLDGSSKLIPIDHGLSMPGYAGADGGLIADKMGNPNFNATTAMPGAHEKFTPAMLVAISKIQPDTYAKGMKQEIAAIGEAHPSTKGQITDEAVDMTRRSLLFLKLGASKLTAAALQTFFAQNAKVLLDPKIDDREFVKRSMKVIEMAEAQQEGLREFMQMAPDERALISEKLLANGWPMYKDDWVLKNPQTALAYYHGNILNPAKVAECEKALGKPATAEWLKTTSVSALALMLDSIVAGKTVVMDNQAQTDLLALRQDFPKLVPRPGAEGELVAAWRKFNQLGGLQALEQAIQALNLSDNEATGPREGPTLAVELIELAAGFQGMSQQDLQMVEAHKQAFKSPQVIDGSLKSAVQALKRWTEFTRLGGDQALQQALQALNRPAGTDLDNALSLMRTYAGLPKPDQQMITLLDTIHDAFPIDQPYAADPLFAEKSIASWQRLQELGGLKALDEFIANSIDAVRPNKCSVAVEMLEAAVNQKTALEEAGKKDLVGTALASELQYVQSLVPRLPNPNTVAGQVQQFAQAIPQDANVAKKALHDLKIAAMDAILNGLRGRIKVVDKRIEKYAEIANAKGLMENSKKKEDPEIDFIAEDFELPRANILAGVLDNAEQSITEIEQRLDDWKNQQEVDPG